LAQTSISRSAPATPSTGFSGAYADFATLATTSTLPFRIINIARQHRLRGGLRAAPQSSATDRTAPRRTTLIYVTFNNQDYKSLTGI
jgi:hypothetical protein